MSSTAAEPHTAGENAELELKPEHSELSRHQAVAALMVRLARWSGCSEANPPAAARHVTLAAAAAAASAPAAAATAAASAAMAMVTGTAALRPQSSRSSAPPRPLARGAHGGEARMGPHGQAVYDWISRFITSQCSRLADLENIFYT